MVNAYIDSEAEDESDTDDEKAMGWLLLSIHALPDPWRGQSVRMKVVPNLAFTLMTIWCKVMTSTFWRPRSSLWCWTRPAGFAKSKWRAGLKFIFCGNKRFTFIYSSERMNLRIHRMDSSWRSAIGCFFWGKVNAHPVMSFSYDSSSLLSRPWRHDNPIWEKREKWFSEYLWSFILGNALAIISLDFFLCRKCRNRDHTKYPVIEVIQRISSGTGNPSKFITFGNSTCSASNPSQHQNWGILTCLKPTIVRDSLCHVHSVLPLAVLLMGCCRRTRELNWIQYRILLHALFLLVVLL